MASLALGVAGAAVGSFFGPLGTSIGWSVGAMLGGALFAKGQSGPRLTDLRVQNSAYGQVIPIGYGTIRVAGNVIWSTDLVESKKKSSGKGGPKITTYSYSVSFAVALCEGPIVGLLRIWADGRLIYGEGSSGTTLPITLYLGDETQLPDPTMEAEEGAGNVPAHRGTAYIVFTALQLAEFGNRIPNLTFEVIASGAIGLEPHATPVRDPANTKRTYTVMKLVEGTIQKGLLDRHKTADGRLWGNVGFHELDGMDRDGVLAREIKRRVHRPTKQFSTLREIMTNKQFEEAINAAQKQNA